MKKSPVPENDNYYIALSTDPIFNKSTTPSCYDGKLSGPKRSIKITDHFTCTSASVMYCLTCTFCKTFYRHRRNNRAQALQTQNTRCMRQLVYIENCMGKSPIVKKLCQITISFEIEFSYHKCVANLSLVPIFKPF